MSEGTTIITCTTPSRTHVFERCRMYRERWGSNGEKWIVVNTDRDYTLNMYSALLRIPTGTRKILIMEDDDWYGSNWLSICEKALEGVDAFGESPALYYHPGTRTYGELGKPLHSSLCSTAFRSSLIPLFIEALDAVGAKWLDMAFWGLARKEAVHPRTELTMQVLGMKGLTSNPCGMNHEGNYPSPDPDGAWLRQFIGDDADWYLNAQA